MQHNLVKLPEIKVVGICVRTNNAQEQDQLQGKIFPCIQRYFHKKLAENIPQRKKPGTTFCAYTDYESDYRGDYTYFIGEEVVSFAPTLPEGFERLVIPEQRYAKLTTPPAPMPDVVVNAWGKIWTMSPEQLGGTRSYNTDFEIYDERASDHQKIVMDLFIGIK